METNPEQAEFHIDLGDAHADAKLYDKAVDSYRKAIEIDPENAVARVHLAFTLNTLNRNDEAEEECRKSIEIDPENTRAHSLLGFMLSRLERYEEAEEAYRKAIDINPENPNVYTLLGDTLRLSQGFDEAIKAYLKAITLVPTRTDAHKSLAIMFEDLKRYDEVVVVCRKAIEIDPLDVGFHRRLGDALQVLKRYEEAVEAYRKLIEIEPKEFYGHYALGAMLHALQRYDEAEVAYRNAITLNSGDAYIDAHFHLGSILCESKRYTEAEEVYREAIEINPWSESCYSSLGKMLQKLERADEAEAIFRKAIEKQPFFFDVYYCLGELLKTLKRYDEAVDVYRNAINNHPNDSGYYSSLENMLRELKRYDEADGVNRKEAEIDSKNNQKTVAESNSKIHMSERHNENSAVMLIDLCNWDAIAEKHGEVYAQQIVQDFHEAIEQIILDNKGRVIKVIGDECMCLFDTAEQAGMAAVDIQGYDFENTDEGEDLLISIGFHYGEVIINGDEVYGDGVSYAARASTRAGDVATIAGVGKIAISSSTIEFLPPDYQQKISLLTTPYNDASNFKKDYDTHELKWHDRNNELTEFEIYKKFPIKSKTKGWHFCLLKRWPVIVTVDGVDINKTDHFWVAGINTNHIDQSILFEASFTEDADSLLNRVEVYVQDLMLGRKS